MPTDRSGGGAAHANPPRYRIEPIERTHDRAAFRCGKAPLDRFLHDQVFAWINRRLASAFVLVSTDAPRRVLGFYTLSITNVDASDLPAKLAKRFPRAAEIGAALLGKLAVDASIQGRGFGRDLLFDALDRTLAASDQVAAYAVVVDAIDEGAAAFYARHGFVAFPETPLRLFLELKTHAARMAASTAPVNP